MVKRICTPARPLVSRAAPNPLPCQRRSTPHNATRPRSSPATNKAPEAHGPLAILFCSLSKTIERAGGIVAILATLSTSPGASGLPRAHSGRTTGHRQRDDKALLGSDAAAFGSGPHHARGCAPCHANAGPCGTSSATASDAMHLEQYYTAQHVQQQGTT